MKTGSAFYAALLLSPLCSHYAFADTGVEEIVVTASPIARKTDEMARSVATLDRDEISRQAAASLGELLENLPGITSSSFARGASRPIIRGLDTFRIRVLENGTGSHDVSALSEDHGIPIDPLAAQRIEIIRGPAVLRYGSAAIGGAVSVLNDRVPTRRRDDFSGDLSLAASAQDDSFEVGLLVDGGVEQIAWHADIYRRESGDYEIPGDEPQQENTNVASSGYALGATRFLDRGHIGASWAHFESEYGIPGGDEHGAGHAHGGLFLDVRQDKLLFKGSLEAGGSFWETATVEAAISDYTHDEVDVETGQIVSTFDNAEAEARFEFLHAARGGFSGAIGFQLRNRSLTAAGEGGELLSPSDMRSFAVFLFEDYQVSEDLNLEFGARIEHIELEGTGVWPPTFEGVTTGSDLLGFGRDHTRTFTPVSVSAGLIHRFSLRRLKDLSAGLIVQYVERGPDILELFAHGPHEATETFEIGNPDARKEAAASLEFAVRRTPAEDRRVSFDIALYHSRFSNFLYKADTGFVCGEEFQSCGAPGIPGVEDELRQIVYLQVDTTFTGSEASAAYRAFEWPHGHLTLGVRYDQVAAEFDTGGNLPRIPPRRWGGSISLGNGAFHGRLSALKVDNQNEVADGEVPTPGYLDISFETAYRIETVNGLHVDIGITGANILDQEMRNHVSFKKRDVLMPGQRLRLFARAQF
jgi:iron complex outermembrane receptor protein